MNNIIKSQRFLCKQRSVIVCTCLLSALLIFFVGSSISESRSETFSQAGVISMLIAAALPAFVLVFSYAERIQMYEIMAGYKPSRIILGKAIVYLPFTLIYLAAVTVICLMNDSGAETGRILVLYWVLSVRATLCIVFLSTIAKEISLVPLFSVMPLMVHGSDMEALSKSPISFLCFGQCALLGYDMTDSFMIKVIVSSVIACAIYYLIGYMTLKKKFDLEPHALI